MTRYIERSPEESGGSPADYSLKSKSWWRMQPVSDNLCCMAAVGPHPTALSCDRCAFAAWSDDGKIGLCRLALEPISKWQRACLNWQDTPYTTASFAAKLAALDA